MYTRVASGMKPSRPMRNGRFTGVFLKYVTLQCILCDDKVFFTKHFYKYVIIIRLLHYQLLIQNSPVKSCTQRLLRVGNCEQPTQINSVKSIFLGVLRWGLHVVQTFKLWNLDSS